ncbi:MAG: hypothetical protein WC648_04325 [Candidatus Paceibacterota bacterium]|jgi:hypothetical protein
MSLETYLEGLRAKPEHVKRRYAFWTSFAITALIFTFWLGSFFSIGTSSGGAVASVADKVGSPGGSMVAAVGSFASDIKDMIFGPKKIIYSSVEARPGE